MKQKNVLLNLGIETGHYQRQAIACALARGQAFCSLPIGTGKTLVLTGRRGKEN